ncbi:hypothetical protein D3C81_1077840 [compost metagenome]
MCLAVAKACAIIHLIAAPQCANPGATPLFSLSHLTHTGSKAGQFAIPESRRGIEQTQRSVGDRRHYRFFFGIIFLRQHPIIVALLQFILISPGVHGTVVQRKVTLAATGRYQG